MNIGILIVCTGNYSLFFETLYKSCEDFFLKGHKKTYYVFTDADINIYENVYKIHQEHLGWPYDTLKRYHIFNSKKDILIKEDYLFFFNANMLCVSEIGEEVIPSLENNYLMAVQHPGFYEKDKNSYTYERNINSNFYIQYNSGDYYYQGCFNGGRSKEFLEMSRILSGLIEKDLENNIIPVWWDESAMNWYLLDKNPLMMHPKYSYPENHTYEYLDIKDAKILTRDKRTFGGYNFLRKI